jgi:ubiquinone/menaquinone biosynthesis C-methylase UbiE
MKIQMIKNLLIKKYILKNGIYTKNFNTTKQKKEFEMRISVAKKNYYNYYDQISKFHSIEVMDREIIKFTKHLKKNSIILDLGCGWCWHWRNINRLRPDIIIVAIDFIKENFEHAKKILPKSSLKQFIFINDNIQQINFKKEVFDSIWTVQVFQHIPNLKQVVKESYRVLKPGGSLFNYNLNESIFVKIKKIFINNKKVDKYYYLNRNLSNNNKLFSKIFKSQVYNEFNEILFHPELRFFFGNKNSFFSKIDASISGKGLLRSYLARQVLMKITK